MAIDLKYGKDYCRVSDLRTGDLFRFPCTGSVFIAQSIKEGELHYRMVHYPDEGWRNRWTGTLGVLGDKSKQFVHIVKLKKDGLSKDSEDQLPGMAH